VSKQAFSLMLLMALILFSFDIVHAQADGTVEVGVFGNYEVLPDSRIEVPIEIRNVQDLYAIDIEIQFDPNVLTCEDADPGKDGVQPALGTFLDAGLALFNEVDNITGIVRLAMTQVNPSEPKSGEGVVLVLYFQSLIEGESELTISKVELSDRGGLAIPAAGVNGRVVVTSSAGVIESTSVPVQDPTQMIAIPTLQPTSTPTEVLPTEGAAEEINLEDQAEGLPDEDLPDLGPDDEVTAEDSEAESGSDLTVESTRGFSLLKYWWVVLIFVLAAVGMAVYLFVSKK